MFSLTFPTPVLRIKPTASQALCFCFVLSRASLRGSEWSGVRLAAVFPPQLSSVETTGVIQHSGFSL